MMSRHFWIAVGGSSNNGAMLFGPFTQADADDQREVLLRSFPGHAISAAFVSDNRAIAETKAPYYLPSA